jgi:hypothetical protein
VQDSQLPPIVNRLRSLQLGLTRSRGHVIGAIAELQRELALLEREHKLVAETLAVIELATPAPKRRSAS